MPTKSTNQLNVLDGCLRTRRNPAFSQQGIHCARLFIDSEKQKLESNINGSITNTLENRCYEHWITFVVGELFANESE